MIRINVTCPPEVISAATRRFWTEIYCRDDYAEDIESAHRACIRKAVAAHYGRTPIALPRQSSSGDMIFGFATRSEALLFMLKHGGELQE